MARVEAIQAQNPPSATSRRQKCSAADCSARAHHDQLMAHGVGSLLMYNSKNSKPKLPVPVASANSEM